MSALNDILGSYQHVIESSTLTHGSKGVFDVTVDGEMLYSKAETDRHAEPGEVFQLFVDQYGKGVPVYGDS